MIAFKGWCDMKQYLPKMYLYEMGIYLSVKKSKDTTGIQD